MDLSFKQILRLQRRYELMPKTVRSLFKQEGIPAGLNGIARIVAANKKVDNKTVRSLIKVLGVDATVAQVRKAAKAIDDTGRKRANPRLEADGVPKFLADFLHVNRTVADSDKKSAHPKVQAEGMAAFFSDFARANQVITTTDGRRADTYIYTHHIDTYSRGNGGGGGGAADPGVGRMVAQGTPSLDFPTPTAVPRVTQPQRRQVHVHVHLEGREIKHYVETIADDRIDQAREFERTQR